MTAFGLRIVGFCARDYVMDMLKLPFDPNELARLGDEFYEREVLPRVTAADKGRIVAIDPKSGTYAIDADQLTAADRVLEQHPGAYLWFRRVGYDYVHRFGGGSLIRGSA